MIYSRQVVTLAHQQSHALVVSDQWWEPQPGEAATAVTNTAAPFAPPAPTRNLGHHDPVTPTLRARSGSNAVVIGFVAGVIAGLIGVGVGAAFTDSSDYAPGVIVGVTAAALGFFLNGWERISAGYVGRGLVQGLAGAAVAAGAGLGGLAIADGLYQSVDKDSASAVQSTLVVGWLAIGVLAGAGVGALNGIDKLMSGLVGGAIGGTLGGLLFVSLDGSRTADSAMLIGVLVASTVLGVAIGLVERFRRQSWIEIIDGPLAGRQLILYGKASTIGAAATCDIALPGDPSLLPVHATLRVDRGQVVVDGLAGSAMLDGTSFGGGVVPTGSVVGLGSTFFSVHAK